MPLLSYLNQRAQDWLINIEPATLLALITQRLEQINQHPTAQYPTILLAEADPIQFLAGFIAACSTDCPVFLGNPNWAEAEWQQVFGLVHPDLIFGNGISLSPTFPNFPRSARLTSRIFPPPTPGWIMIPTGGSSGNIRFVIHTLETLAAATQGFQVFFEVEQIHAFCVLPLYHVSGLMQILRSLLTGGRLAILPFKQLEHSLTQSAIDSSILLQSISGLTQPFDSEPFFLSLVPTQLQRLLQNPVAVDWLQQFPTIFVGGAPAWPELLTIARQQQLPLAPTYGMTETAAQIATLKPHQFLQGATGCGQILPHARVEIKDAASVADVGLITIQAKSLMLGYFPDATRPEQFWTDDLGYLDTQGILHVVGRNSQKIITGGENVFATEVEAAIRATGLVNDVCVVGMPDQTWGEVVTAVYVPSSAAISQFELKAALAPRLSSFKHPKQWIAVDTLSRNAQGKINPEYLKQILESYQTPYPHQSPNQ
ncbi:2-succinylbenzoate--CoA ligase [Leptolyngbya sp. NK1-12]|uniref:2-succinylbenzoate--CoA ligase n=1 Tax=Leptolyngbya sp. NK1-12 TaxID=2547451 RepID=A0AA96WDI4_9CYAN|nr:2-succinylbenzoate--CoA ligase [Leptolyngbya sp. NK1-12]WNZ23273.1 2-succinylbenzoate--CoA ligase [Leptolyngbya sp. NK1-12]